MLPADRLAWREVREQIVPEYLSDHDAPWLGDLIELVAAHAGRRRRDLDASLREPLPHEAPPKKLRMAAHVLAARTRSRVPSLPARPVDVRRALFLRAAELPRQAALAQAASDLGLTVEQVEATLLADLPSEREVLPLDPPPSACELALQTNLALVQGLLRRATRVDVALRGNAHDVVRYARLRGLLCVARPAPGGVVLELSGPYALFRRTTLYGRAQAALVPRLAWCEAFTLTATCALGGRERLLQLRPSDPIFPSAPPRRFDSKLEERFARDLLREHPEWVLTREPEPLQAGDHLIFPDFGLCRRDRPERRWLVEIVGFWTPAYLERKLAGLRAAGVRDLVLCVDRSLDCSSVGALPDLPVVWFDGRVRPDDVLAALPGA